MKIKDLFDYKYGVNLELINCQQSTQDDTDSINFVARTSINNGVVSSVKIIEGLQPQKAGTLSLAVSGSVLSCFVQNEDYYSGRDLYVLTPKINLSLEQKIFYAMCINKNAYRYSYGRAANKTFPFIEIPDLETCNQVIGLKSIKPIKTKNDFQILPFHTDEWNGYKIEDIFESSICESEDFGALEIGSIIFIGRTSFNNGVQGYVSNNNITNGNSITIGMVGSFSPFWQERNFVASQNILNLRNYKLNKYNALYIVTILKKMINGKYSYNRPIQKQKFIKEYISLPTKNNQPDWDYMENYIKSLSYGDRI